MSPQPALREGLAAMPSEAAVSDAENTEHAVKMRSQEFFGADAFTEPDNSGDAWLSTAIRSQRLRRRRRAISGPSNARPSAEGHGQERPTSD